MSPFLGLLISLFGTSTGICPRFKNQGRFPHLHALSPVHNRFLRFISGVTPADLLAASMAAELFHPHTCKLASVGLKYRIKHATASQHVARQMLYQDFFDFDPMTLVAKFDLDITKIEVNA